MYAQTLLTLEENPLNGMCSPSLMGSHGVVPLTIISVIPDIIQVGSFPGDKEAIDEMTALRRCYCSCREGDFPGNQ